MRAGYLGDFGCCFWAAGPAPGIPFGIVILSLAGPAEVGGAELPQPAARCDADAATSSNTARRSNAMGPPEKGRGPMGDPARRYQSDGSTMPSSGLQTRNQVVAEIEGDTLRTEPSDIATRMPPVCALEAR